MRSYPKIGRFSTRLSSKQSSGSPIVAGTINRLLDNPPDETAEHAALSAVCIGSHQLTAAKQTLATWRTALAPATQSLGTKESPYICTIYSADRQKPTNLNIRFKCRCGREHLHAWHADDADGRAEHRSAHCDNASIGAHPAGYFIRVSPLALKLWMRGTK